MIDPRDALILSLAEKLYICSRLLTAAAERLGWDADRVRDLVQRLENSIGDNVYADVEAGK